MSEIPQSPEVKKSGAPIEIIFGIHEEKGKEGLGLLDKSIGDLRAKTGAGRVIVVLESAFGSEMKAKVIEGRVKDGIKPSLSYGLWLFKEKTNREASIESPEDMELLKKIMSSSLDDFSKKELDILDKYSGQGLEIMLEARPDNEAARAREFNEEIKQFQKEALSDTVSGFFDDGIDKFKHFISGWAADFRRRDEVLSEKIASVSKEKGVAGIVGFRGSGHALLIKFLSEKGCDIRGKRVNNSDEEESIENIAISAKYINSDKDFLPLEWRRMLIGFAIQKMQVFESYKNSEIGTLSNSKIKKLMEYFDSDSKVGDFEKQVRLNGFKESVESLIKSNNSD